MFFLFLPAPPCHVSFLPSFYPSLPPSCLLPLFCLFIYIIYQYHGLPRWLSYKESTCQAGDAGLIPRLGRYPGERNGNPLPYSCLGNPLDFLKLSSTLSSKFFSTFPYGTCWASMSCPYLALDGVYHPLWAAFSSNPAPGSLVGYSPWGHERSRTWLSE